VQANSGVVRGQSLLRRDLGDGAVAQLDVTDDLGVFGLEAGQNGAHARAVVVAKLGLVVGIGGSLELGPRLLLRTGPAVVIDDRVTEKL
jgi:hypothetical protein